MTIGSRLIATQLPARPAAAVLLLHGGARRPGRPAVSARQPSVLRMIPIARRIGRADRDGLAVFRLLNTTRGWNDQHSPVDDVHGALAQVSDRLGAGLPVCLVGHSLGGRAALLAAAHPSVRSVVALAPWLHADDGDRDLTGRKILISHGSDDRVADPTVSARVATELARTALVGYVSVAGAKHAMLRHRAQFDGLAADFATATLLDRPASGIVAQILGGEQWVEA